MCDNETQHLWILLFVSLLIQTIGLVNVYYCNCMERWTGVCLYMACHDYFIFLHRSHIVCGKRLQNEPGNAIINKISLKLPEIDDDDDEEDDDDDV